jgi:hypothetical protein
MLPQFFPDPAANDLAEAIDIGLNPRHAVPRGRISCVP